MLRPADRSPSERRQPLTLMDSVRRSSAVRISPTGKGLVALCCGALVLLAGCGSAGSGQTTRQSFSVRPEPSARAGQLPVPAGRLPTQGPIGLDPATANGVQLDVLSGLLYDTPIYNGDFADPFALRTADDLYIYSSNTQTTQYAAWGTCAGDRTRSQFGLPGQIPRGRTAVPAQVDRPGLSVGTVVVDATGRHQCHVLLDAGHDSARVSGQDAAVGVCQDHQRGVERDVHLARDERQSRRTVRR